MYVARFSFSIFVTTWACAEGQPPECPARLSAINKLYVCRPRVWNAHILLFRFKSRLLPSNKPQTRLSLFSTTHLSDPLPSYSFSAPALNVTTLLIGFLLDRYGPRRLALASCAVCIAGCLLFGASDSVRFNAFLPVSALCLWSGSA